MTPVTRPAQLTAAPTRIVYILAASHSGSTLLALLLARHPEICTVGELKATSLGDPTVYRCSCRAPIRECPFWQSVGDDMAKRGFQFDIANARTDLRAGATAHVQRLLQPLHRGPVLELLRDATLSLCPSWRSTLARFHAVNATLAASICARLGKRILVDSSKVGLRLKYLLRNPALDVRVVRLIRDGRAVALTYMNPDRFADASDPRLRGGGGGSRREPQRPTMAAAAIEWRRSNEEAHTVVSRLSPTRWTEVRYETLTSEPERALRHVFEFLGVDAAAPLAPFKGVQHHVIGNGMRLDDSKAVRLDDRWKSVLTGDDLRTFDHVAGGLNRQLGYQ